MMKYKFIIVLLTLIFIFSLCLNIIFITTQNKKYEEYSLKSKIVDIEIKEIVNSDYVYTEDDINNYMDEYGMNIEEVNHFRQNREEYSYAIYTVEIVNNGNIDLIFLHTNQKNHFANIWLSKTISKKITISPGQKITLSVNVLFKHNDFTKEQLQNLCLPLVATKIQENSILPNGNIYFTTYASWES